MLFSLSNIFRGASAPAGTRIYAIGDIHGYDDALDRLLAKIKRHSAENPIEKTIIVFLGDYTSRGPHSNRVVARLAHEYKQQEHDGVKRVFLLGDHDYAFKAFLNTVKPGFIGEDLSFFLDNGGLGTLRSFGIAIRPTSQTVVTDKVRSIPRAKFMVDTDTIHEAQLKLRALLPQSVFDLYNSADVCFTSGDYFFVHAAVDPDRRLDKTDQHHDLLMGMNSLSKKFPKSRQSMDKVVVHGHTISSTPYSHRNQIGVDTGIYQTGILSCAVLTGKKVSFLQAETDLPLFTRPGSSNPKGIKPPGRG